MAFEGSFITIAGLCEIVLPDRTIRLCDGAFIDWPARGMFTAEDEDFGTLESVDTVSEALSDEAPSGKLTMLPPSLVEASTLFQPNAQGSPMRFWLAEVNAATGELAFEPDLVFSGRVDTITIRVGRTRRTVEIEFMAEAERLFWTKEGNVLSPRFHKDVFPGELGLDFATGTQLAVAWGTADPGRGTTSASGHVIGPSGGGFSGILGQWAGSQR